MAATQTGRESRCGQPLRHACTGDVRAAPLRYGQRWVSVHEARSLSRTVAVDARPLSRCVWQRHTPADAPVMLLRTPATPATPATPPMHVCELWTVVSTIYLSLPDLAAATSLLAPGTELPMRQLVAPTAPRQGGLALSSASASASAGNWGAEAQARRLGSAPPPLACVRHAHARAHVSQAGLAGRERPWASRGARRQPEFIQCSQEQLHFSPRSQPPATRCELWLPTPQPPWHLRVPPLARNYRPACGLI